MMNPVIFTLRQTPGVGAPLRDRRAVPPPGRAPPSLAPPMVRVSAGIIIGGARAAALYLAVALEVRICHRIKEISSSGESLLE